MKFFKPKFWDKNQISFLSIFLYPISLLLKMFNFFRRLFSQKYKCSIPIICVGNIYLGGTGKTPLSIEIFSILKILKKKPVFIRKKYVSFEDEVNLQKRIGQVYEANKRIDAINNAIKNEANVAILDDGFQDFSIYKNFSIVCFTEKQWIGNGFAIPSGPLREDLSALNRANCVIINGKKNLDIEKEILKNNKEIKIFYIKYKPKNINEYLNKKIISFAGIGNPENFFNLLKENNMNMLEEISFPDHYKYSYKELEKLINKANNNGAILLTTEKDHCRIDKSYRKKINCLEIQIEIENRNKFIDEIKKIL